MLEDLYEFQCPYCWQPISVRIDLLAGSQQFIEDCEVCCNPIEISYRIRNQEVLDFQAEATQSMLE